MAEKINKKNIAENSTEVSLKTSSDFQSPSNRQELQLPTGLMKALQVHLFITS